MNENCLSAVRDIAYPLVITAVPIFLAAFLAYFSGSKLQRREWKRQREEEGHHKRATTKSLLVRMMIEACSNLSRLLELDRFKDSLEDGVGTRGRAPRDAGVNERIKSAQPQLETYDAAFPMVMASEELVHDFSFAYILGYARKLKEFLIPLKRISEETQREQLATQIDVVDIRRMLPNAIQATRNVIAHIELACRKLAEDPASEAKRLTDIVVTHGVITEEEFLKLVEKLKSGAEPKQEHKE